LLISPNCDQTLPANCQAFPTMQSLDSWLSEIALAVNELVELSRACGMRFDLTQAAGGNISVKCGGQMLIKSSGIHLVDVGTTHGYSVVHNDRLKADLQAGVASKLEQYVQFSTKRPSIETFMHAALSRYTVHLHPLQANVVLTALDGKAIIGKLFPDAQVIEYITPGLALAKAIRAQSDSEQVIFLLNHGVIFTTSAYESMMPLIEKTLAHLEQSIEIAPLKIENHAFVNPLAKSIEALTGTQCVVYLCEDAEIAARLSGLKDLRPTFPDAVVYCGESALQMPEFNSGKLQEFIEKYGQPKLVLIHQTLYIVDVSLRKCRDVEAVLKSILLLQDPERPKAYLASDEVQFLNNWDAEKYRRDLKI